MKKIGIKVPNIGNNKNLEVIEILVSKDDFIEINQSIITLESGKSSIEVPSTNRGIIRSINVKLGDKVSEGSLILTLEEKINNRKIVNIETPFEYKNSKSSNRKQNYKKKNNFEDEIIIKIPKKFKFYNFKISNIFISNEQKIKYNQKLLTIDNGRISKNFFAPFSFKVNYILIKIGDRLSKNFKLINVYRESTNYIEKTNKLFNNNILYSSPSIRELSKKLDLNLNNIHGSGFKNRITIEDINKYSKYAENKDLNKQFELKNELNKFNEKKDLQKINSKFNFDKFGEIEISRMSRIKKISGDNLYKNWVTIPHVTNNDDADITELEKFIKVLNREYKSNKIKITFLSFIIKAVSFTMKEFPEFNSSLDKENIIYKKYYNIGFAIDTKYGIVVPVIKNVLNKGIFEISKEIINLIEKSKNSKILTEDISGGCFTISSLGSIGCTSFTPIVNSPEVAILGISRASKKLIWNGKRFIPRLILPLSLSYDHRVIDGALACRFNNYLINILSDLRRIIL